MSREQEAILGMVAVGRITPREGERLLAAASTADERWAWLAVCGAAAWLVAAHVETLVRTVAVCVQWAGGVR